MATTPGWLELAGGNLVTGMLEPYRYLIGDFVFVFMVLMFIMTLYIKSQDFSYTAIVGIILSASIQGAGKLNILPVETYAVASLGVVLGILLVFYKLFFSEG